MMAFESGGLGLQYRLNIFNSIIEIFSFSFFSFGAVHFNAHFQMY